MKKIFTILLICLSYLGYGQNSLFGTQNVTSTTDNDHPPEGAMEVGMKFISTTAGYVTGVKFFKTTNPVTLTGTHIGELYSYPGGSRLGQVTFTAETASGWQFAFFTTPIFINANTPYVIAYYSGSGFYTEQNDFFLHQSITQGNLTAPEDGTNGFAGNDPGTGQGFFKYTVAPAFPNQLYRSANYWVDVIFQPSVSNVNIISVAVHDTSLVDFNRPFGGAENWIGQNTVFIPNSGFQTPRLDFYYRFSYGDIAPYNGALGQFDSTFFLTKIKSAIDNKQKFSFCIMPLCPTCSQNTVGGAKLFYRLALHNAMQALGSPDFIQGGEWIPAYLSTVWLNEWKAMQVFINNILMNGTYKGVRYRDVINYIDVSGYADYGEWSHNFNINTVAAAHPNTLITNTPAGIAAGDSIISYQTNVYKEFRTVMLFSIYDGNQLSVIMIPPAVGYYALNVRNNTGLQGWRRDQWGWTDAYIHNTLENNPTVFNGYRFDTATMNRYMFAPIVGEPADLGLSGSPPFFDLARQMQFYHAASFGNGNLDQSVGSQTSPAYNNYRTASKYAGYHIAPFAGTMSSVLSPGGPLAITLNWRNFGSAPTYENWIGTYVLKNSVGNVVWSGNTTFNARLFLPAGSTTATTDNFTLTGVTAGNYKLYIIFNDPVGYRDPLVLNLEGRLNDGSYLLADNVVVGSVVPDCGCSSLRLLNASPNYTPAN